MRTTLGWLLAAVLLAAVPATAQETPNDVDGWRTTILDELEELPILGWLVGLVTDGEDTDPRETVGPTPPSGDTSLLDSCTDTEARGGWEPEG